MFGIIVLRNLNTGTLAPNLPNGYEAIKQDANWFTLYSDGVSNPDSMVFHAHLEVQRNAQGVYSVFATDQQSARVLYNFAQNSTNAWTLRELRADGGAAATQIKNAWRASGSVISGTNIPYVAHTMWGFSFNDDAETYATLSALSASASL
jgi:hypothetical protein